MSAFGRAFARLGLFVQRHRQRQCLASSPGAEPRRATSRSSDHSSKQRAEQQQQRSDGSSSSDERQSHGPPTGRGASCTNMNVHMAQGDGREPPIPPPDGRECALSRRALEGQRHARAEQQQRQQRRASVPRPAKGCGDSCTDMSVNMTQIISRRARRARRRRDKERRERALSRGALDEQRQQRRASVPRPAKGCGDSCTDMSVNMTQIISRRARRARRRRDKERRERALSRGALDEQRQQRAGQQQRSSSGGRQSRDPSRDAVFRVRPRI